MIDVEDGDIRNDVEHTDARAVPIPDQRLEAQYSRVVPVQVELASLWRRLAGKSQRRELCFALIAGISIMTIFVMLPLKEYKPVFVFLNENGLNDTATTISDLPPDARVAGIQALLWNYLKLREHYSPSEADVSYNTVSALSSQTVMEQYQKWANPKLNENAPANKLGQNGYIRIYRRNAGWITHAPDYSEGVYRISFCRVVVPDNQPAYAQTLSETIRYTLIDTVPLIQRITFNPIGLMVTEYPGPEVEGANNTRLVRPGSDNPCGI